MNDTEIDSNLDITLPENVTQIRRHQQRSPDYREKMINNEQSLAINTLHLD